MVDETMLRKLHAHGLTDREIADVMGIQPGTAVKERSNLNLRPNVKGPQPMKEPSAPRDRPNPLAAAATWLGNRLTEKDGSYRVDGVPHKLEELMKKTNRLMAEAGFEMIGPPHWRP